MDTMIDVRRYEMSFGTGGLFITESVATAELAETESNWKQVSRLALEKGTVPFRKASSSTRTIREIVKRIRQLSSEELELLRFGERHEQQAILWLAICRTYRFIREFAVEVLYERYLSARLSLTYDDFDIFFEKKAEWNSDLSGLSVSTRAKLRQVLFRILREAGITAVDDTILMANISPRLENLIVKNAPAELHYFPGSNPHIHAK